MRVGEKKQQKLSKDSRLEGSFLAWICKIFIIFTGSRGRFSFI